MKNLNCLGRSLALLGAMAFITPSAHAQTFSTGTFTDASVLAIDGTSMSELYGATFSGPDETVDDYTFTAAYGNSGNSDIGLVGYGAGYDKFLGDNPDYPYTTTGDASFDSVVGTGVYNGNSGVLTLNGLTAGKSYKVLVLSDDDRTADSGGGLVYLTDNGLDSGSVTDSYQGGTGAVSASDPTKNQAKGAYITDTFTEAAGQTTHTITLNGAYLNAVLVSTVPEPSNYVLLGLGAGGLALILRRRRNV